MSLFHVCMPVLSKQTFTKWQTNQELYCLNVHKVNAPCRHTQIRRSNTVVTWGPIFPTPELSVIESPSSAYVSSLLTKTAHDSWWVLQQEARSLVRSLCSLVQASLSSASFLRPCICGICFFGLYSFRPLFIGSAEAEILCLWSWHQSDQQKAHLFQPSMTYCIKIHHLGV